MTLGESNVFGPAISRWISRLGTARDAVRQELVTRQLHQHLPAATTGEPVRVLDVGCGQGTQAIRLASAGYHVTGVDPSPQLLGHARRHAAAEPETVCQRLRWVQADLFSLAEDHLGAWDVVCCHGVVMYLPSLHTAMTALVELVRPGGLVSILSRNQAGIAMRAGMTGQWGQALAGFDAKHYTNRLGLDDVRADHPHEVQAALAKAGADTVAWYGVRLFTDHWDNTQPPPELDDLLAVEEHAGRRDPYRQVAALTHTLATRRN